MIRSILIGLCLTSVTYVSAIIACPDPVEISVDSTSTVNIRIIGDENCKYALTEDGYSIVSDSCDVWHYLEMRKGGVGISEFILQSEADSPAMRRFKSVTPRGIGLQSNRSQEVIRRTNGNNPFSRQKAVVGQRKVLIILAAFQDKRFSKTKEDFENLFNQYGYHEGGASGSVRDYFNEVSEGQLDLTADVVGPFTSKYPMSWYGGNVASGRGDARPYELFMEALTYAKSKVNLIDYDSDGDGYIDNIHIIYAGYGEEAGASSNAIWAHECTFEDVIIDSQVRINKYSCSPELRSNSGDKITTIGPPCHEICHALGAMDYYDTDYAQSGGQYGGTGVWDVMGSGSWNNHGATPAWPNAYVRCYDFGWVSPIELSDDGDYGFGNFDSNIVYRLSYDDDDFYLLDYHDKESFRSYEPEIGMLILHVGPDIEKRKSQNNINAKYPQQCYPVCASACHRKPTSNPDSYGDADVEGTLFPGAMGKSAFHSETIPAALSFDGDDCEFSLTNIAIGEDRCVTFHYNSRSIPDYEDVENCVWRESFEKSNVLDIWNQTCMKGRAEWNVEHGFEDVPHGNAYLVRRQVDGVMQPLSVRHSLKSGIINIIPLESDDYNATEWIFDINVKLNRLEEANFILQLYSGGECFVTKKFSVKDCKEWKKFSLSIGDFISETDDIELELISEAASSSVGSICIDNLVLRRGIPEESMVESPMREPVANNVYYDLLGRRIDKLSKGIYVSSNGEKILIR